MFYGTNFKDVAALIGWDWDTRNRTLFADRGMRQRCPLSTTIPGATSSTGSATQLPAVRPDLNGIAFSFEFSVDYGAPFGSTTALPPYRQFFGGGPDDVRGFRESRLGPKDQFGNPYGGNMRVTSRNELILPMPAKWRSTARVSVFFDMGNVFETSNKLSFYGPDRRTPQNYNFTEWNDLQTSVGVSVQWLAPLGLFRFSLGMPLNRTSMAMT